MTTSHRPSRKSAKRSLFDAVHSAFLMRYGARTSTAQLLASHSNDATRKRAAESYLPAIARHDPTCIDRLFNVVIRNDGGVSDINMCAVLTLAKAASIVSPSIAIPETAQTIVKVRSLCDRVIYCYLSIIISWHYIINSTPFALMPSQLYAGLQRSRRP